MRTSFLHMKNGYDEDEVNDNVICVPMFMMKNGEKPEYISGSNVTITKWNLPEMTTDPKFVLAIPYALSKVVTIVIIRRKALQ